MPVLGLGGRSQEQEEGQKGRQKAGDTRHAVGVSSCGLCGVPDVAGEPGPELGAGRCVERGAYRAGLQQAARAEKGNAIAEAFEKADVTKDPADDEKATS